MKRNKRMILAAAAALACAAFAGRAVADEAATQMNEMKSGGSSGQRGAKRVIGSWPSKTKTAAQALIEKYGMPDAVSDRMLLWNNKGEWLSVAVFRDPVMHNDPVPHEDFVENWIKYEVPEGEVADLAKFNHSLVIDQTRGTLSSHCDSEKNNTLALNLANEIVTGKRDVASARTFLKKTVTEAMAGKSSPYADGLMFTPASPSMPPAGPMPERNPRKGY